MDNIIITNESKNKKVELGNIEHISNIKVVREKEKDISDSSSVSVSVSSGSSSAPKKKTKIVKKIKQKPLNFEDYNTFSNPKKVKPQDIDLESEYSSIPESEYSGESDYSDESNGVSFKEKQKMKQDLLIKIQALEKKGFEFSKKFTMTSDYSEMEFEYEKVKKFIETQGAVRFSRRCLMACVTGLEFLNRKFDPFSVKLDGWSENVMETIDDYDNIFEKLHEKYSGKAEIAPEIELLLTLGGSAFMFHLTNSLLKTPTFEGITKIGENIPNKGSGNFMANMMGAMSQGMKEMNNQKAEFPNVFTPPVQSGMPKTVDTRGPRKEMRGPSIDPGLFGNVNNYPMPPGPVEYHQQMEDDDRFSVASSDSSISVESIKRVNFVNSNMSNMSNKSNNGNNKNGKSKGFELNIK